MDYVELQTKKYLSHEDENEHWTEGQRRAIDYFFDEVVPTSVVLDAGCGDGVGLEFLQERGFTHAQGIDLSEDKIERGWEKGLAVFHSDLHELTYTADQFDVVYSSHSLEHCHDPVKVVSEFKRVLKEDGQLFIVLPFPDRGPLDAHCGSVELRTRNADNGDGVVAWFEEQGFTVESRKLDNFRESEIWLKMRL